MVKPLWAEIQEGRKWRQTFEQRQEQQERQARETAQRQQAEIAHRRQQINLALADRHQIYPERYVGDEVSDMALWKRTYDYARESGYSEQYGERAGLVFAAQRIYAQDQERLAMTGSPTAGAMREIETRQMELARTQAAGASRTVGAGAPTHAAPAAPPP